MAIFNPQCHHLYVNIKKWDYLAKEKKRGNWRNHEWNNPRCSCVYYNLYHICIVEDPNRLFRFSFFILKKLYEVHFFYYKILGSNYDVNNPFYILVDLNQLVPWFNDKKQLLWVNIINWNSIIYQEPCSSISWHLLVFLMETSKIKISHLHCNYQIIYVCVSIVKSLIT